MKNLLAAFIIALPFAAAAQNDTTKTMHYCDMWVQAQLFKKKMMVSLDFGTKPTQQEVALKTADTLKNFTNEIDALNYTAKRGWVLTASYALTAAGAPGHFFLKKEF